MYFKSQKLLPNFKKKINRYYIKFKKDQFYMYQHKCIYQIITCTDNNIII